MKKAKKKVREKQYWKGYAMYSPEQDDYVNLFYGCYMPRECSTIFTEEEKDTMELIDDCIWVELEN